ncbi:DNA adenine methylase [Ramlibacter sp.]|uniref:DNA adenine methylase n=1 Tax=Ramlibacter sp. TaxID=1917967 RepID=UPI003D0BF35E
MKKKDELGDTSDDVLTAIGLKAKPIVPWVGGKRRLAAEILPWFEAHTCYVEPFAGAAALLFNKTPSKVEVLNDVNTDLVNLYRVVRHHLEEFVRQFKWALTSRKLFEWAQATPPETLTDIQRAARFFYLQKLAFGAKVEGQTFGTATTGSPALNLMRIEEELSAAHLRLSRVVIEHLDWAACIERYDRPHTLFYCDPPYWGTEGYGVGFGLEQYDRMAELLRTMQGKAIVSVNDIPEMRRAFKGLTMRRVAIRYSVGASGRGRGEKGELLVRNW